MKNVSFSAITLFLLNLFDAVLTVYWVRNGFATEANHIMATLLDWGNLPFLAVKIAIGAVTAFVLWYGKNFKLARYGLTASLFVYCGIMAVHFVTGLSAGGLITDSMIRKLSFLI